MPLLGGVAEEYILNIFLSACQSEFSKRMPEYINISRNNIFKWKSKNSLVPAVH